MIFRVSAFCVQSDCRLAVQTAEHSGTRMLLMTGRSLRIGRYPEHITKYSIRWDLRGTSILRRASCNHIGFITDMESIEITVFHRDPFFKEPLV